MKTPIEQYLANQKPHATGTEDVSFYMDRLHYYQSYLDMEPKVEKAWGYGEHGFKVDRAEMESLYAYWLNAMVGHIETCKVNSMNADKPKKKKKKKEKK